MYSCLAESDLGTAERSLRVSLEKKSVALKVALPIVILFAFVVIVSLLLYYRRKVRRTKERLSKKDVEMLVGGDPEGLKRLAAGAELPAEDDTRENLPLLQAKDAEAALMLPYDKRVEFPWEKLTLGSQVFLGIEN